MMLLAAGALITVLASPSPSPAPVVDVETGVSHESLSNGRPPWNSQYILLTAKNAEHQVMYMQLSSNQRFNQNDDQILLGAYIPVGERWTATAEAN
ncbi:MAG TPA: YaiO family outer membrane beta-barrel protein, partial [Candidatus Baltobacteraceae bacterium]|nr:YaiO family outer membrane beta-barrel protein [Candidatus Baltobacteraceae bacterium]